MLNARKLPATWKLRVSPRLCVTASAVILVVAVACALAASSATQNTDDQGFSCSNLPNFSALKNAIASATAAETSGLNNQMWATLVNRDGVVCAVAFSGVNRGAQWPGSRVISAQKANTANAFSLDASSNSNGSGQPGGLALSTANLYSAVQPGGCEISSVLITWPLLAPCRPFRAPQACSLVILRIRITSFSISPPIQTVALATALPASAIRRA